MLLFMYVLQYPTIPFDLLFADDAAITTHTQEDLQRLLDCFSDACRHFGLTISLAKTQVMGQGH